MNTQSEHKRAICQPQCPVDRQCGGCKNLSVPYDEQLQRKDSVIAELFSGILRTQTGVELRPTLGMAEPYHYRNKVMSPFVPGKKLQNTQAGSHGKDRGSTGRGRGKDARGSGSRSRGLDREVLTGMYAEHSHRVISTDSCLIENQAAKRVIQTIARLMQRYGIQPYREDQGTGFMRHAVVRVGHQSGEMLVTLVTNQADFPASKAFCRELVKRCPEITTIVQNINTRQTNVVMGTEERTLYGPGFILDTLCDLSFRISSQSFYQVNAVQTEVLYRAAIELAQLTGAETIMDAYCGTGTIGLVAAAGVDGRPGAARVIGVEERPDAVADARNNARHNGIEHAEFVAADASAYIHQMAREGETIDVLLMDPPRSGSTPEFIKAAAALGPRRIVYISCNPKTQVRDIYDFIERGYDVECIQPVDMFPHTEHIESIVSLIRQ